MRRIWNAIRRLWYRRPEYPAVRLCPVSGCEHELRNDYELCGLHAQLCPPALFEALKQSHHKFGSGSLAYNAALRACLLSIERIERITGRGAAS